MITTQYIELLKTLPGCVLAKVSPSPDQANFAALCTDSSEIIIGDLTKQ